MKYIRGEKPEGAALEGKTRGVKLLLRETLESSLAVIRRPRSLSNMLSSLRQEVHQRLRAAPGCQQGSTMNLCNGRRSVNFLTCVINGEEATKYERSGVYSQDLKKNPKAFFGRWIYSLILCGGFFIPKLQSCLWIMVMQHPEGQTYPSVLL